jgi:hypothetical protein
MTIRTWHTSSRDGRLLRETRKGEVAGRLWHPHPLPRGEALESQIVRPPEPQYTLPHSFAGSLRTAEYGGGAVLPRPHAGSVLELLLWPYRTTRGA